MVWDATAPDVDAARHPIQSSRSRATRWSLTLGLALLVSALAGCASSGWEPVIREFNLPDKAGSTHELAVGPGGDVWVTQQLQGKLVRVTPQGHLQFHSLPPNSGPHGIAFDHAGHIWVTLEFDNAIAELDRNGQILHTYQIPEPGTHPHGLAVAEDGNIWWTGKAGDDIGRLDPRTGQIGLFHLPRFYSEPIYIVQGCGAMYFTELTGSRIGRITNQGRITEYPTLTYPSRPIAVARAPHGCQIYFTEESGHHFGALNPVTGRMIEWALPQRDGELSGLAFDGAGRLWLEFISPDAIGLVGPGMKVREYALPTQHALLHRIILGLGGNMWFTELASDKVGYITTH